MNKNIRTLGIALGALLVVTVTNNFAFAQTTANTTPGYKVAVVDVQKVVARSSQVNALKEERKSDVKELSDFVTKAKADVAAEKDATKKKALEDKYNLELNTRKDAMDKDYAQKLTAIDKTISNTINQKAKEKNYNLVLTKGIVLYGGDDITDDVSKAIELNTQTTK